METLTRRRVLLGLHCVPMSHKKDAMLIWVKSYLNDKTIRGLVKAPDERTKVRIYEFLLSLCIEYMLISFFLQDILLQL